jgi:hypothetical protein
MGKSDTDRFQAGTNLHVRDRQLKKKILYVMHLPTLL